MTTDAPLFDTHAHLDFPKLYEQLDEVVERARLAGVERIVAIGASRGLGSNERALEIARRYDHIYCTAGIHPHEAEICDDEIFNTIVDEYASLPEVVAIGETGLDYYYDNAPKETQKAVFRRFCKLAIDVDKPIIIHSRDADDDTIEILSSQGCTKGIIHCFTGSAQMAHQAVELGFHISFSGIATFKNARELRDIAAELPADRILVETDSPYLAPSPHRGSTNEPANVQHTAAALAEARGDDLATFRRQTYENGCRLYGIS
jgi:TatD DNase family protein